METQKSKKLKTGDATAEKKTVIKPHTAVIGHKLKNAKSVNRAMKKVRTEAKRRDESRTVETASYMAEGTYAAYSAGNALLNAPGAASDAAKRLKKIPYKLASDFRRYKNAAKYTVVSVSSAPSRIKNTLSSNITRKRVKTAVLHTAVVGSKTTKTAIISGFRGITKTATVAGKGFSLAGSALSDSDNETVRAAGMGMKTAETGVKVARTTVQVGQKTAKTASTAAVNAARAGRNAAIAIKAKGVKQAAADAASTASKKAARAAAEATKKVVSAVARKLAIPMIIVIFIGAAMNALSAPVSAAVIYVKRLMPFTSVFEWVDGVLTEKDSPMKDTLELYIQAEASVAAKTNGEITRLLAGMNEVSYNTAGGVIDPKKLGEYTKKNAAYQTSVIQYEIAVDIGIPYYTSVSQEDGSLWVKPIEEPPVFDKSPYLVAPVGSKNEDGQYVTDGSEPATAPKYEGAEWNDITDLKSEIPAVLQKEMIAALVVNKIKLEEEGGAYTDWTEEEVEQFYNSLPHWELSITSSVTYCDGCEEYTYEYEVEVEVEHKNPDGSITITTETVTRTAVVPFCPGHIKDYINIQTDEDPDKTIIEDQFSMNRVFEKLGFTEAEIKLYEETLKNIEKEMK
jgi:hypothetical protein